MTIITKYLVGPPELFDETIRFLIASNWNAVNTNNKTPIFISPHGQGTNVAVTTKSKTGHSWDMKKNKDLIRFKQTETNRSPDRNQGGDEVIRLLSIVTIDIFGQTPHRAFLFQEEVNRIIQETRPNQSTRVLKSNGTQNSAIAIFDRTIIDFLEIGEFSKVGINHQLAGELGCIWQKQKT